MLVYYVWKYVRKEIFVECVFALLYVNQMHINEFLFVCHGEMETIPFWLF